MFDRTRFWKFTVLYALAGPYLVPEESTLVQVPGFMDAGIATHVWLGPRYTMSPKGLIAILPEKLDWSRAVSARALAAAVASTPSVNASASPLERSASAVERSNSDEP